MIEYFLAHPIACMFALPVALFAFAQLAAVVWLILAAVWLLVRSAIVGAFT
jgi:flagellar biogenesis protein FliO